MRIEKGGIPCILILLCFSNLLSAQSGQEKVAQGNRLYQEEKYDEANTKYRDALVELPDSPIINFNIGDVQYKKRNFEEALKAFEKSLSSEDILTQSKSYYNMGNTVYKLGKLPESIQFYKKALELNPNDEDAKYNLEYVRAKLKDQSEKQQQNQDEQQQDQQEQNQEQIQEQNPENQEEQESSQEQQQNQKEQDKQNENEEEPDNPQQDQVQPKEISKEDAERILDALQNDEEDLLKEQKKVKAKGAFRGKDW